jgi:hypothetical protein
MTRNIVWFIIALILISTAATSLISNVNKAQKRLNIIEEDVRKINLGMSNDKLKIIFQDIRNHDGTVNSLDDKTFTITASSEKSWVVHVKDNSVDSIQPQSKRLMPNQGVHRSTGRCGSCLSIAVRPRPVTLVR